MWQIVSALVVVVLVLWEHAGRILGFYKPSFLFTTFATWAKDFWGWLGGWYATLSAFLDWLKLDELWTSITDLFKPLLELVFSWFYFFKSYVEVAATYSSPILVVIGSLIILAILGWALNHWNLWPEWLKTNTSWGAFVVAVWVILAVLLLASNSLTKP